MNFKKFNQLSIGFLMITSVVGVNFNSLGPNQQLKLKNVKAIDWNTINIIEYNTNINYDEAKWNISLTLGTFEAGTTAADILTMINDNDALGISFKYNNEESVIENLNVISIQESDIQIDVDNNALVSISIDFPPEIQIIYDISISKDYNGSDWENWLSISDVPLINKIDTSLISLNEAKSVASNNVSTTKADVLVPIKYDDTKIVAGAQSLLVIENNLQNLSIKSNDIMLEIETITVQENNTYLRADVDNLETVISLTNLSADTEYNNLIIDLDGDDATTGDIINLNDFSVKTTVENDKLTPLEISSIIIMSLLIIGILIFVFLIIYQNIIKKD